VKFGLFFELEFPRPWVPEDEYRLFEDALEQIELADRLGFDYAWATEHHFLEEYAHCSAPEVFLAAASQRTKRIRLAHGVTLLPHPFNHPARVAERVATLDLLSRGRLDFGTGESATRAELEGFGIHPGDKREMWTESVEQIANMLAMDPFPGHDGKYFSMPCRNVVPKPYQKPHPPLWVACSQLDTIKLAAQLGLGATSFTFLEPAAAKQWVDDYYHILATECVPIAHTVNPNILLVSGFGVHKDADVAIERFLDGLRFFQFSANHYYRSAEPHKSGRTDIWAQYMEGRDQVLAAERNAPKLMTEEEFRLSTQRILEASRGAIGSVEQVRARIRSFAETGIDQLVLMPQGGRNRHDHICESLELFAKEIMEEFREGDEERQARKMERLAPCIEKAFERKGGRPPLRLPDDEIPEYIPMQPGEDVTWGRFDPTPGLLR
jgi:alkanesulfonate monooxygenase SsuD/methylene tetrahydromethanopterin reductase-like flavin-dependent oxidoreductase (luciferase family)